MNFSRVSFVKRDNHDKIISIHLPLQPYHSYQLGRYKNAKPHSRP
jgi:hypothetical protein